MNYKDVEICFELSFWYLGKKVNNFNLPPLSKNPYPHLSGNNPLIRAFLMKYPILDSQMLI